MSPRPKGQGISCAQSADSDLQILERIQHSDEQAILLLYDRYSRFAYSIIFRVLRDESTSEELMQDVFMQLWREPGTYDPSRGTLRTWMAVVCRHRAVDQLRKRRHEVDINDVTLSVNGNQEQSAGHSQLVERIKKVLSRLPAAERLVFELTYFEGYTHREISAKTGQPLGTVKSRLRAAVSRLRSAILRQSA